MKKISHSTDFEICERSVRVLDSAIHHASMGFGIAVGGYWNGKLNGAVGRWMHRRFSRMHRELSETEAAFAAMRKLATLRSEIESYLMWKIDQWLKDTLAGTPLKRHRRVLRAAFAYAAGLIAGEDLEQPVTMRISRMKHSKDREHLESLLSPFENL